MIDLRAARNDSEAFRAALARKGAAEVFDELLEADRGVREIQPRVEELRAARKVKGKPTPEQLEELERVKIELQSLEQQLAAAEGRWGDPRSFDFPVKDHLELAAAGIDLERGAKVSGSRFAFRSGDIALLELALYRFALDRLTSRGFTPVLPPVLVREEAMYGTGFFPTDEVNIYAVERDELYLVGTSEVPLAAMHGAEILDGDDLPLRYAGYSTCFRREAGAAGKDTRGMFRVHQFDKIEMFVFTRPESSRDEHDRLLDIEEALVQELELPYRVVNVAAGDLGASATKKYDIEAWFPSQERYREITSTSNTTDYQARRLEIRYRRDDKQLETVHTLNGTAVTGRAMLAIMENFQEDDGSVSIPGSLHEFGAPQKLGAERTRA